MSIRRDGLLKLQFYRNSCIKHEILRRIYIKNGYNTCNKRIVYYESIVKSIRCDVMRKMSFRAFTMILYEKLGFYFDIDNNDFDDRFKMQKYMYFAKRFGLKMPVSYSVYHHGPYSPDLAKIYYNVERYDEELIDTETFDYEKYFEVITDKDNKWLEIASTTDSVYDYNKVFFTDDNELKKWVVKKVTELKGCSEDVVKDILSELEDYKLVSF